MKTHRLIWTLVLLPFLLLAGFAATPVSAFAQALPDLTDIRERHILDGEINRRGRATGFHFAPAGEPPDHVRLLCLGEVGAGEIRLAKIAILDPKSGRWRVKKAITSLFPPDWSREAVLAAIRRAYEGAEPVGRAGSQGDRRWRGCSEPVADQASCGAERGLVIEGWVSRAGRLMTAYPVCRSCEKPAAACLAQY